MNSKTYTKLKLPNLPPKGKNSAKTSTKQISNRKKKSQ